MRKLWRMRKLRAAVPVLVAGLALFAGALPVSAAPTAVPGGFFAGYAAEAANPGGTLPGVNDWDCEPTAEHPRPVVLVHGTAANAQINWNAMAPTLKAEGYCLFAPTFGILPAATSWPLDSVGPELGHYRPVDQSAVS